MKYVACFLLVLCGACQAGPTAPVVAAGPTIGGTWTGTATVAITGACRDAVNVRHVVTLDLTQTGDAVSGTGTIVVLADGLCDAEHVTFPVTSVSGTFVPPNANLTLHIGNGQSLIVSSTVMADSMPAVASGYVFNAPIPLTLYRH